MENPMYYFGKPVDQMEKQELIACVWHEREMTKRFMEHSESYKERLYRSEEKYQKMLARWQTAFFTAMCALLTAIVVIAQITQ